MNTIDLEKTARALVAPGKGILAADESTPTITKRFQPIGVSSTEENRRLYREMFFTAAGLGDFISGVILFDETIRQKSGEGSPLPEVLRRQNIIPGIKVDKGAKALAHFPGEKITEGLDGLRERLAEYVQPAPALLNGGQSSESVKISPRIIVSKPTQRPWPDSLP